MPCRLRVVPGARIELVSGDVVPVHGKMVEAAGGRNVWIVGGGDLAGQFADAGLLDEVLVSDDVAVDEGLVSDDVAVDDVLDGVL